ncbi:hypothetical protein D4R87_01415 [bacterium]|nr:MAG: hypothetical protein D4R87_01415 [bacterium]
MKRIKIKRKKIKGIKMSSTRMERIGDEDFTQYGEEESCAGCKTPVGNIACSECFDFRTNHFRNFQPETDYHHCPQ